MDARPLFDGLSKDAHGGIDADELLVRMLERGMAVEEVGALFRGERSDETVCESNGGLF